LYDACNTFPEFLKTVTLTQSANKNLFAIEDTEVAEDSVQSLVANSEPKKTIFPDTVEESIRINETAAHRMI
jgi:hypothetical protein